MAEPRQRRASGGGASRGQRASGTVEAAGPGRWEYARLYYAHGTSLAPGGPLYPPGGDLSFTTGDVRQPIPEGGWWTAIQQLAEGGWELVTRTDFPPVGTARGAFEMWFKRRFVQPAAAGNGNGGGIGSESGNGSSRGEERLLGGADEMTSGE